MRSGNLKNKIIIQTYSEENNYGEIQKSWSDFATVYASIKPLSAKEYFKAGVQNEVTHKIEMRFIPGVKPKMRVMFGEREFSIESVLNIREENKTLHLICTEVV